MDVKGGDPAPAGRGRQGERSKPVPGGPGRQAERSQATRAALIGAARELFAARGYGGVGTEEIVRRARVTRGALYHHFRNKEDLFRAVFEQLEDELTQQIAAVAASAEDPYRALAAGADAFLDACLDPAVQRITLLDAPAVLGWQRWREIGARYGLGLIQAALQAAMDQGLIVAQPVAALAHVMLGALDEAAMLVAQSTDEGTTRDEVGVIVARLLTSLRVPDDPPG
ncbi:MAG: TetR/AcrR family transcriptional regulator [Solirubrobacteraceae bacterium]